MTLVAEYNDARRAEGIARVRRAIVLRAMNVLGLSQREIAASLGISQPAVSQQVAASTNFGNLSAAELLEAAAPILRLVAEKYRYTELAVFGSVARGDSRAESDIDLLVQPPPGTSSFDFVEFKQLVEKVLGREIDLISYGGLDPVLDADILHDKRLL
ncbi:MAG: nucleotidyltransferase domain-containing protein [Brevibacterium aurantiacum]|uniref:Cro/Cl family transcriptional regulator n=1 Tax=Brevibacterium aurantiacum TaxID=273384 RepID=A0A2A3Z380_BREAU|nr:nucleotidyltransferase domain-containing protein [Brevibacterium aurantiacum]AZT92136.1 Cro/Cl family transcriptional regulator [Brevibacterium aurantiacum]PCC45943.1 Cro/Cl family transcriptional regulator [Brevibacterium aurantiacum]